MSVPLFRQVLSGLRGPGGTHRFVPVRLCARKVEDRTHWNPQGQGYKIPTAEKDSAKQALDYWRPFQKWTVLDYPTSERLPLFGLLALVTGIPIIYFLSRRREEQPPELVLDPTANKSPFKPRPELAMMSDVIHNVSDCPGAQATPCANPGATPCANPCPGSGETLQKACPAKIPKVCSDSNETGSGLPEVKPISESDDEIETNPVLQPII